MNARRFRARLGALAALSLAACAGDSYRFDAPRSVTGMELFSYAVHEECVALETGKRIDYYFTSTAPVAFNLHYREANAVIMPIVRENVTQDSGAFSADRNEVYCLAWEAGAQPSLLDYRLRPLPPRP
jgi:hypothetical protein